MRPVRGPVAAAIAGALCISTSAVVMRLAGSSPSVLALGRSGFALPALAALVWLARRLQGRAPRSRAPGDRRAGPPDGTGTAAGTGPPGRTGTAAGTGPPGRAGAARGTGTGLTARERWLGRLAGAFLAGDLVLWAHSIADIGAGLGTVLANLQVIVVPLLAWLLLGERPRRTLLVATPLMLLGLALVGGVLTGGGYGTNPGLGAVYGIGVAVLYSGYILLLRQAADGGAAGGGGLGLAAATLLEATLGAAAGSLVIGLALRDFRLGPAWPALGWLVVLALTSGVLGWLLITVSLPRLPAWLASSLLLVQPAASVLLGAALLRERPSPGQLAGVAAMLGGVLIAARGTGTAPGAPTVREEAESKQRASRRERAMTKKT